MDWTNSKRLLPPLLLLSFCALAAGCGDDGGGEDSGSGDATPEASMMDASLGGDAEASTPDADVVMDICDRLGLPRAELQEATGTGFGDVAGSFFVNELDGRSWSLRTEWTGCESYVFLNYFESSTGDDIFDSYPDDLFRRGPENVHYFFTSYEGSEAARVRRMEALRALVIEGLELHFDDPAIREAWLERFHFVTDRFNEIGGSVGDFARDFIAYLRTDASIVDLGSRGTFRAPAPYTLAIARDQTFDPGGSLSPVVGMSSQMKMASYFGDFYNYRAALRERLAAEADVTEVSLLEEDVTSRVLDRTVTLPAGDAMAGFDTLEFDIAVTCPHRNPFACSEWDRIARIAWCTDAECGSRVEVVRWITPYWRRGRRRWVIDATPFLGLIRAGGEQTFRVEMGPSWERGTERHGDMSIRLSTRGERPLARGVEFAFGGGNFGDDYNTREPFSFTPPASATRVELVVILSGHGQTEGLNCAEWCDHRHHFSVNGTALDAIRHSGRIGSAAGCGERASDGVPPGQWGNWAPERAYWCPGLPVDALRFDITEHARVGEANELTYQGAFQTGPPRGGNISLSSYVVWYED